MRDGALVLGRDPVDCTLEATALRAFKAAEKQGMSIDAAQQTGRQAISKGDAITTAPRTARSRR